MYKRKNKLSQQPICYTKSTSGYWMLPIAKLMKVKSVPFFNVSFLHHWDALFYYLNIEVLSI